MLRPSFTLALAVATATMITACGSNNSPVVGRGHVGYGDPKAVEVVTINFGSTDLQMISEKMVSSLLTSGIMHDRPTITVSTLRNKTSEYIDMGSIMNSIQAQLIQSGQVRFVRSTQEMQAAVDELTRQNESGYYDPNKSAPIGRMIGARYMLEGELTSINKVDRGHGWFERDIEDVYYKFTLKLIDTELGTIEWMDEQEIRKTSSR